MTDFKFQGKTYRIVPDVVEELVAGCKKCAFSTKIYQCAEVDGGYTGRQRCSEGNHHYEEVTCSGTA